MPGWVLPVAPAEGDGQDWGVILWPPDVPVCGSTCRRHAQIQLSRLAVRGALRKDQLYQPVLTRVVRSRPWRPDRIGFWVPQIFTFAESE